MRVALLISIVSFTAFFALLLVLRQTQLRAENLLSHLDSKDLSC